MTPFSLRRFALLVLRVANLTFGGGDPTMAALHRELVVTRGWLTAERYGLIYSLARATPGTNMLAFCAGIGRQFARFRGALVAVLSASIPCAAAVLWFTYVYTLWRSNPLAMSASPVAALRTDSNRLARGQVATRLRIAMKTIPLPERAFGADGS